MRAGFMMLCLLSTYLYAILLLYMCRVKITPHEHVKLSELYRPSEKAGVEDPEVDGSLRSPRTNATRIYSS